MADVSPGSLRQFLLGRLPDAGMDALGERIVADDAFGDEMAEAEDALIDAYLAGALPAEERTAFERHYLATAGHRARVETRRALTARGASPRLEPAPRTPSTQATGFGATRWMALAASLLLAVGLFITRPAGPAGGTPPAPSSTAPSRPAEPAPPAAPAVPPPAAMPTVALTLAASTTTRGTGTVPTLAVPRGTAIVHLRLVGDLPPAMDLTAELTAVDRDEVKRWPVDDAPAAGDGATRVVSLPPYAVPAGDYVLTLWAGDADVVQRYAFRIAP